MLSLREVSTNDSEFFEKCFYDFRENEVFDFAYKFDPDAPFSEYIKFLKNNKNIATVQEGDVHSAFLLAEDSSGAIVGRISIRLELNDFLKKIGGHIGYAILSEYRKQGYGTEILRLGLEYIKKHSKLRSVLITCDETNVASSKIIEANNGVFENLYSGVEVKVPKKRYWINLSN